MSWSAVLYPCQHLQYSLSSKSDCNACVMTRATSLTSNMMANESSGNLAGLLVSAVMAFCVADTSGPCGLIHTCRLAPAGAESPQQDLAPSSVSCTKLCEP